MNLFSLSLAYLRTQRLTAALNVLLLALGVASITVLLLLSDQLQGNLERDADGFDLVVGAKGSPVQLILSSVYHVDIPTGNIDLEAARSWARHRLVSEAIPLALGDGFRGFRIVGTEHGYPESYGAVVAEGRLWRAPLEAVLGARVAQQTGLAPGDSFVGAHGLAPGGHGHDDNPYKVVGILEPTDTVLDRLILTDVRSVWQLHGTDHAHHDEAAHAEQGDHPTHDDHEHHAGHDDDHEHHEHEEGQDAHDDHDHHDGHAEHGEHEAGHDPHHDHGHHDGHAERDEHNEHGHHEAHQAHDQEHHEDASAGHEHEDHAPGAELPSILAPEFDPAGRQITALLLKSDSLTAGTTLPRLINSASNLQAAAPVAEVTRLLRLIGFGLDTLRAFAGMVILAAALSVFVALYNALQARRFDLAVMRSLGASRGLLLRHILLEGQILALAGVLLGLLLGHLVTEGIGLWLSNAQLLRLTGWTWLPAEGYLILLGAGVGLAAALLPAVGAYRADIARTLARS